MLHIWLDGSVPVFFEHHVILWKDPGLDIGLRGKGALKRMIAGMQLLMTESYEFGRHQGLGFIEGSVVKFDNPVEGSTKLKVPQIEWNNIRNRRARGSHICLGNKVNHDLLRAALSQSDIGEVLGLPLF